MPNPYKKVGRMGWWGVLWRGVVRMGLWGMGVVAVVGVCFWWTRGAARPAGEVFRGVVYECRELPETRDVGGLAHLVRVDLKAPGVGLYVTGVDGEARRLGGGMGWEYQTRWAPRVAREEGTAVMVNATMFGARYGTRGLPGDWARSVETLVSEHEVNHVWEHTYLMWFEDDLTPHMERTKPPTAAVLAKARWGVGGQGLTYLNGAVASWANHVRDRRTVLGLDEEKKVLYIGVFESASEAGAAAVLADFGAKLVMLADGGTSTSLCFGEGGKGVARGGVVYPWRSLPTFFGVRAGRL